MKEAAKRKKRRWPRWVGVTLLAVLGVAGLGLADAYSGFGAAPAGARLERMERSPRFTDGAFHNELTPREPAFDQMIGRYLSNDAVKRPDEPLPVERRRGADLAAAPASGLRLTWMGHSSYLIDLDGTRLLTDPVWSERASLSRFVGPARFHPPPLPLEELPALSAVVISHDHYDHLDEASVKRLAGRGVPFVVPLGVGAHLESWGVPPGQIVELDWWEEHEVDGVRLVATPARHFSGRAIVDRNRTLWASYAFVGPTHRVFFSGDTAMSPDFAEIGERLGPFAVTLVESGAYDASWADFHLGPEQAVAVHEAVRGELLIPIHWGTFDLALHGWTEPAERVRAAARERGVRVAIPRPGQSVEPAGASGVAEVWWPEVPWQTAEEAPVVSSGLDPATRAAAITGLGVE